MVYAKKLMYASHCNMFTQNLIHVYVLLQVCDASGIYPTPKVICTPINRDFLNRRLSVQVVWLKERLQQLNSLCPTVDDDSTEDSALLHTCRALQHRVHTFILSLTNYVSN